MRDILKELKKANLHLEKISDEVFQNRDVNG